MTLVMPVFSHWPQRAHSVTASGLDIMPMMVAAVGIHPQ